MGQRIIKQPDNKFGLFSTFSDRIWAIDLSEEEIVELWKKRAAQRAEEEMKEWLEHVKSGQGVYSEFMTVAAALKEHQMTNMASDDEYAQSINERVKELKAKKLKAKKKSQLGQLFNKGAKCLEFSIHETTLTIIARSVSLRKFKLWICSSSGVTARTSVGIVSHGMRNTRTTAAKITSATLARKH